MNFKIDGESILAKQLQEIFLNKQDLIVKFNNVHEFKTKIYATQIFMDQDGKIYFSAETGELNGCYGKSDRIKRQPKKPRKR